MSTYWANHTDVILPSLSFASAQDFFNNVKPPFYETYDILIVDDNTYPDCFNNWSFKILASSIVLLTSLVAAIL